MKRMVFEKVYKEKLRKGKVTSFVPEHHFHGNGKESGTSKAALA